MTRGLPAGRTVESLWVLLWLVCWEVGEDVDDGAAGIFDEEAPHAPRGRDMHSTDTREAASAAKGLRVGSWGESIV